MHNFCSISENSRPLFTPEYISSESGEAFLRHHLGIFGVIPKSYQKDKQIPNSTIEVFYKRTSNILESRFDAVKSGLIVISVLSEIQNIEKLGINFSNSTEHPPQIFKQTSSTTDSTLRLRTLNQWQVIQSNIGKSIVNDTMGSNIWLWYPLGLGGILFIGTDLVQDLIQYRQGDPKCVTDLDIRKRSLWGFDFERPVYLYEQQLLGESQYARSADDWMCLLVNFLSQELNIKADPILPHNAKGAVIITGDDDQAFLETYENQLKFLKETPITYFMHPLTKHTQKTIKRMLKKPYIDIGLHPDALDDALNYKYLLNQQTKWFETLFDFSPISVRNHGYLNDGYWGHLDSWLENKIKFSSNIPGLNGRLLTGSLLPARVLRNNQLTDHWSILTAIGDGIVFINGCNDTEGSKCIYDLADQIIQSKIPGILVINLHPQNFQKTIFLHQAILDLIKSGFHPWTMTECYQWFHERDVKE